MRRKARWWTSSSVVVLPLRLGGVLEADNTANSNHWCDWWNICGMCLWPVVWLGGLYCSLMECEQRTCFWQVIGMYTVYIQWTTNASTQQRWTVFTKNVWKRILNPKGMFEQQLTNAQNCEGIQMAMPNSFKPAKGNQTLLQEKLVLEGPNKGQESWSKPFIGGLHRFPFSSSFWKVQAMPSMPRLPGCWSWTQKVSWVWRRWFSGKLMARKPLGDKFSGLSC